jgi:hypothetical protein
MQNPYRLGLLTNEQQYDPYYDNILRAEQLGYSSQGRCNAPGMFAPPAPMNRRRVEDRVADQRASLDYMYRNSDSPDEMLCGPFESTSKCSKALSALRADGGISGATESMTNLLPTGSNALVFFLFVVFIFVCYVFNSMLSAVKDDVKKIKHLLCSRRDGLPTVQQ